MVVAAVVMLGAMMVSLDETAVNVALDRLAIDFGVSFTTIQWVVTGYTLSLAAVIPITGWAADRFGSKRIYLCSVAAFMAGSALCAVAWSAGSLIAFRVIQGVGGGMILPAVTLIVTVKAGPHRRGRVMGFLGVPLLAAPILGPILGGWLLDNASWRWIFLINVPVGILAIILGRIVLESDQPQPAHKLDWLGLVLFSPGLALLLFGLGESSAHGFGAARSWLPTLAGAVLTAMFFRHSWRTREPLIDVKTFTHTRAGPAAVTVLLLAVSLFGALLLMPLYFETARGASALEAGLLIAPQSLGAMMTMPLMGWLTDRYGPRLLPVCGIPLVIVGLLPFVLVTADTSYSLLCAGTFVQGLGIGIAFSPTMTLALGAVPPRAISRTSSALSIISQAAASIGTAIVSVVLAAAARARVGVTGVHGSGLEVLHELSSAQRATVAGPLSDAFATTFFWALVLLILSLVPALVMALGGGGKREAQLVEEGRIALE